MKCYFVNLRSVSEYDIPI